MLAGAIEKVPSARLAVACPKNVRLLPWLSLPEMDILPSAAIEPEQAIVSAPPCADPVHEERAPLALIKTAVKMRSALALVEAHLYVPA
jgi:hypothetical protein